MEVKVTNNNGRVVMAVEGRLDTAASASVVADVNRLLAECGTVTSLVLDAGRLDYISSSGLRILLDLSKRYNDFSIIEATPVVYQVFDVTGFTKIIPIQKALRRLSVDGCEIIGVGGVGTVYRIDDDTIIKVFREETTMDELKTEITLSKEAFILGMPTAISFDIVQVGRRLGLVYELLRADTLSACVRREPERIDEFARLYAGLFRQLHSIHVPLGSAIPSALEREMGAIRHISRYFDKSSIDLLLSIADEIPKDNRLLHCDLQTKNAMVQQSGELMLIDMGEVGYGHPLIDLGHAYSSMVSLLGPYEDIIGLTRPLGQEIWNRMITYYFENTSQAELEHRIEQIQAVSVIRNFAWLALSDSFPDVLVRQCQDAFDERVTRHRDHLLDVSRTFNDWQ